MQANLCIIAALKRAIWCALDDSHLFKGSRSQHMFQLEKGIDLPIEGAPRQEIGFGQPLSSVAILGGEFHGMRPSMAVHVGDEVRIGDPLFEDRKSPGVRFVSPATGRVAAINRGAKRALQSVEISIEDESAQAQFIEDPKPLDTLSRSELVEQLVNSGLWVAFRTRPFSRVPSVTQEPHSIFVTAMDTNPLAADANLVIGERPKDFASGVSALTHLTDGSVFVCMDAHGEAPAPDSPRVSVERFDGPHPAGLAGTHIHFLDPVDASKTVWSIGYQEVIAIGRLFTDGVLDMRRVVSLAGPGFKDPRLVETRVGASIVDLVQGELAGVEGKRLRCISGSVLTGHQTAGPLAFLGRLHCQVSVIFEDAERKLFGYLSPGRDKHSVLPIYLSRWLGRTPNFTTTTNGSPRAMVPIGTYEAVVPLDVLPTQLLRAILVGDIETAIALGALELDEEDLALCTYACPAKYEYGPVLRAMLTTIEKEG